MLPRVGGTKNDKFLKKKSGFSPIDVTIFLRACRDAFCLLDNTHLRWTICNGLLIRPSRFPKVQTRIAF